MYAAETAFQARPVLKWAGGKARLLPELLRWIPGRFAGYHEPLMGGGALFFTLASAQVFSRATLSDINPHLMDVYLALRDDVEGVIAALRQHQYNEDHYYQVRALRPEDLTLTARAARIIFLNKTCYNGLYRENRAGQFNVPFGRYRNPTICDENNLRAASLVLQGVDIGVRPFTTILDLAHPGDFVYFDPPYHPVSTTARFTQYSKHGFTAEDQRALRDVFAALGARGVTAMLSNSDTPFIRELYADFHIHEVQANRAINSRADRRGKITELIICNYP